MTTQKQQTGYLGPFLTMVFLFFIVGFLTTVNNQFQVPLQKAFLDGVGALKNTFTTLITFSWFLAYPIFGGVGSRWTVNYGYKGTLLRSLVVMVAGLALFFLSSWITVQYPDMSVSFGASTIPVGFSSFCWGRSLWAVLQLCCRL